MILRNNKTIITHNIKNNNIKYSKNAINGGELRFRFAVNNMGDLDAVKNQLTNVEDRLNELLQLQDRLPLGLSQTMEPKLFSGLIGEDANTWLQQFSAWTDLMGLRDINRIRAAFNSRLDGLALNWFNSLPQFIKDDKNQLFDAFLQQFNIKQPRFFLEQRLSDRNMLPGETLDTYITAIEKLCRTLEKNERDKISAFIRLPNELKAGVLLQKPQTWYNTIEAARLAQQTVAMMSLSTQYIPATSAQAPNMMTHAAHSITLQPDSYSSTGNNSQVNQMDAIVLMTETQRDLRSCMMEFSQASRSIIDSLAALRTDVQTQRSYNNFTSSQPTGYNSNSNNRSVLICQYCKRNGHSADICFILKRDKNNAQRNNYMRKCEVCGKNNHTTERCYYRYSNTVGAPKVKIITHHKTKTIAI